jgi:hypothetical protein
MSYLTRVGMCQQILENLSDIEFNENLFCSAQVITFKPPFMVSLWSNRFEHKIEKNLKWRKLHMQIVGLGVIEIEC